MSIHRVVQNTSKLLRRNFLDDEGEVAIVADVALRIETDEGLVALPTTLVPLLSGTEYGFTVTADLTTTLERLKVTWSATVGGNAQQYVDYVEVVGGVYFTVGEARARVGAGPTAASIMNTRTAIEMAFENYLGYALVPRYSRVVIANSPRLWWHGASQGFLQRRLRMPSPYTRVVRWARGDDEAIQRFVEYDVNLLRGYGTITIGFEHGLDYPPEDLRQAALDYLQWNVQQVTTTVDTRAERLITDDGTLYFNAGFAQGGPTPLPAVNSLLNTARIPSQA